LLFAGAARYPRGPNDRAALRIDFARSLSGEQTQLLVFTKKICNTRAFTD